MVSIFLFILTWQDLHRFGKKLRISFLKPSDPNTLFDEFITINNKVQYIHIQTTDLQEMDYTYCMKCKKVYPESHCIVGICLCCYLKERAPRAKL